MFAVYEIFPDGGKYLWFENADRFECEVFVEHHRYDTGMIRRKGFLVIEPI